LELTRNYAPIDATCIASVHGPGDKNRATALFVGTKTGLLYLSPKQARKRQPKGENLSTTLPFSGGIRRLETAQDGNYATLWFTNADNELGYLRGKDMAFSNGHSAMLLPAGQATFFSACVSRPTSGNGRVAWQMLVAGGTAGNLTLLQQASDTGLWRPEPFYRPSAAENVEVESYTVTIKLESRDGTPLVSGSAFVASASAVDGTHNGERRRLTTNGDWYKADGSGMLHFIIPTTTLGGQTLRVTELRDLKGNEVEIGAEEFMYDPSAKPMEVMRRRLESFKSTRDFAQATTQTGKALFEGPDYKEREADLTHALRCFEKFHGAYTRLQSGQPPPPSTENQVEAGGDSYMDAWHWVKTLVSNAVDWVVDTAGEFYPSSPYALG
jgi:hypothetical protein